ncbi:hypothetical protein EVAR_48826_1 [Eumeta japonica]|uniref:Uncharacterized protein n=1 Tax=Eumeta variegata TaxID=151549 RepID=A0A4C1Y0R6_EUMVA|nr:hypothetical protein EVAR_48826_1 [Eumeta japonica]
MMELEGGTEMRDPSRWHYWGVRSFLSGAIQNIRLAEETSATRKRGIKGGIAKVAACDCLLDIMDHQLTVQTWLSVTIIFLELKKDLRGNRCPEAVSKMRAGWGLESGVRFEVEIECRTETSQKRDRYQNDIPVLEAAAELKIWPDRSI